MSARQTYSAIFAGSILVALASITGCQSTQTAGWWNPFSQLSSSDEVKFEQPARMAVIWRESTISQPGRGTARGFGGRVYFYNQQNEPIRVDGELTVYAFDDSTSSTQNNVPDRKYVFKQSDLQKHFSETDLGSSYSIWIPWDKIGGQRKTIALLPVFQPEGGMIVNAGQSIAVLPGKTSENLLAQQIPDDESEKNYVRQVSGTFPAADGSSNTNLSQRTIDSVLSPAIRRKPTTIRVPRSLGRRMTELTQLERASGKTSGAGFTNESTSQEEQKVANSELQPQADSSVNAQTQLPAATARPVFGRPGALR